MNIIEAVKAAKDGITHIKRKCWDYNTLMVFNGTLYIYNKDISKMDDIDMKHLKYHYLASFFAEDILADDWEVFE